MSEALNNQAIAIAVQLPEQTEHEVTASLAELTRLAATLGIEASRASYSRTAASCDHR